MFRTLSGALGPPTVTSAAERERVANKAKPSSQKRRDTIEAMRRQQRAAERRKTILFVSIAALVGLALIAAVAVPSYLNRANDPLKQPLASLGVPAAQAACDAEIEDAATAGSDHRAEGERVDYATVPPSLGPHSQSFEPGARPFYTPDNRPAVETLVHNLEHGYAILWYDASLPDDQLQAIEDIANRARTTDAARNKFIAAPLDDSRGKLPEGKRIALSHWGDSSPAGQPKKGYRQLCGAASGAVVEQFITAHPYTDAPEGGAA